MVGWHSPVNEVGMVVLVIVFFYSNMIRVLLVVVSVGGTVAVGGVNGEWHALFYVI